MIFPFSFFLSRNHFCSKIVLVRCDSTIQTSQREREWGDWLRIRRLNTLLATMYRHGTSMKRRYYPDDICWRADRSKISLLCALP